MSKKILLFLFLVIVPVVSWAFFFVSQSARPAVPIYGIVPPFKLLDSNVKEFSGSELKGKVWVVDFIFTTCSGICPMMTKNMMPLYNQYHDEDNVRLVSVSVNPEYDSPQVLKNYAANFNVDTRKWYFLTGDRSIIENLSLNGFKVGTAENPVFHSGYFILVDQTGRIRGYYDGTDKKNVKKLGQDIKYLLLKERH